MVSVFRAIYFQNTLGYSPLQVGSMLFFANLPTLFTAPIAGYLADKYTPRLPIAIGYFLLIITCLCFGFLPNPPFWLLNLILVGFAMGSPSIFTPSYAKAVASVPAEKAGTALGMLTTLRMLGGTMGLSLIYLFASKVQEKNAPIIGETNASILSFSYVHFGLVVFLLIAYTLAFVIQNRKSSHTPPSSPSQGWD
jgi:MFS family permease